MKYLVLIAMVLICAGCSAPIVVPPTPTPILPPIATPTAEPVSYTLLSEAALESHELDYWDTDHNNIVLLENDEAVDVSYDELVKFLLWDNSSDEREGWTCGQHSEATHNIAERVGIKAYFVVIEFSRNANINTRHFLLAFDTTDRGRVFIDCYGGDGVGTVEIGEPYIVTDITDSRYSYQWGDSTVKKIIVI
ncbi:hypothetical protein M0R72_13350 [Candidatus Pacearchaeota archaeon]|jgi:hypothetical protein|nr:hypothetical protein [Candidatus Pacearchaeota archaeon]